MARSAARALDGDARASAASSHLTASRWRPRRCQARPASLSESPCWRRSRGGHHRATPARGSEFASLLTEGLVAAGHHVTLFATADSITTASLHATAPFGWSEDATIDAKVAE